jgi:dTDP-4-amino-4,6-dideoxygalactose transaminase
MVVTNEDDLADQIRSLRNHGMGTVGGKLDFVAAGFNYRMNELEAVLGIIQMREIQEIISERQRLAGFYMDALKSVPGVVFQKVLPNCTTVWQAFVVRFEDRDASSVLEFLRNANIEVNIGTYALHILQFYSKKYGHKPSDYPKAAELYSRGVALPFYNHMTQRDIVQVLDTLRGIFNED